MLKSFLFFIFILTAFFSEAQNIPNAVTAPAAATARKLPATYAYTPVKNYVRVFTAKAPIADTSLINMSALVEDVNVLTAYNDSYGRMVETVAKQTSPAKKDNVAATTYDEFGRTTINYLPYTSTANNGAFKTNPFYEDSVFYKDQFPNEHIHYTQTLYDGSPFNILIKSIAQGNSWGGSGTGVSFSSRSNTSGDSVVLWTIGITDEDDIPVKTAFYAPGTLIVREATDENGIKSVQYLNERGQTVLSKVQLAQSPGSAHIGWLCTYYIYDEMGQVRFVLPPKATEAINNGTNSWSLTTTPSINTNLCYAYFYDDKGRCIMKRIPGKGKIYFAFDGYNRVVMQQDQKLRLTDQWVFSLFDSQNRPDRSGVITSALSKDSIIAQASRSLSYPTLSGTYTITGEVFYDDYSWIAASGTSLTGSIDASNINGSNFITTYNSSPAYAQQITSSSRIRGFVTGSKTNILNTGSYVFLLNIYDNKGRTIQKKEFNAGKSNDTYTVQYDYSGKILRSHQHHTKLGTNTQSHTVVTKYEYDHQGRIKSLMKNFDGLGDKYIGQNTYNELGQLQAKIIGNSMETQQLAYNIRGWLTGINQDHVNLTTPSAFFGESIAYDIGFTASQLNGNKAGIKWRSAGDSNVRAYGYAYDHANRLTNANFSQQNTGSTAWTKDQVDYTVSNLSYDANGNILSMSQRGLQTGSSALIDSLDYQYFSNSNQLQKVADAATAGGALGDFKDSSNTNDDYTYDANGNINRDNNRRMHTTANAAGAVFNILDKADSIVIAGKATTYYYYDASGLMLSKKVNTYTSSGLSVKNYQYSNGFVYLNDTLQYALIEGGRIRYTKKKNSVSGVDYYAYEYDYFINDHMGNVRTVLTEGKDTSTYKASMEVAQRAFEDSLFSNITAPSNTIATKPAGFDSDGANGFVAKLNAAAGVDKKTGPSLVLKVMAGDQVQMNSYAFYNTAVIAPAPGVNLLSEILSVLSNGVVNNSGGKLDPASAGVVNSALGPNVVNFLNNGRDYDNTKPKAYLNWILFDNQFNFISTNSGVVQVQPGSSKQALVAPLQHIAKNGYLYVYVSNESAQDVYFDDVTIKHITGPLVQEQAYYPYGLQMHGLSDKAFSKPTTSYKYNGGNELEEEDGIGYYNTFYRKYDAQIGRFTGVDVLSEKSINFTPYSFGANNPAFFNDPNGDRYSYMDHNGNKWHSTDPFSGTVMQGQQYTQGYGIDGFGDTFGDNGSSGGGGNQSNNAGVSNAAANWMAFEKLWNLVPDNSDAQFTDLSYSEATGSLAYSAILDNYQDLGFGQTSVMQTVIVGFVKWGGNDQVYTNISVYIVDGGAIGKADVGHTALEVRGTVYGYYNTGTNLLATAGQMRRNTKAEFHTNYKRHSYHDYTLRVTDDQANSIKSYLESFVSNPGTYSLLGNQCTSVVAAALAQSGVYILTPLHDRIDTIGLTPSNFGGMLSHPVNSSIVIGQMYYNIYQ